MHTQLRKTGAWHLAPWPLDDVLPLPRYCRPTVWLPVCLLQSKRNRGPSAAPNPLLGDVLVVLAQLLAATQFVVEEKFLAKYHAPVLMAGAV